MDQQDDITQTGFQPTGIRKVPRLVLGAVIITIIIIGAAVLFVLSSQKQKAQLKRQEFFQNLSAEVQTFPSIGYHWQKRFDENITKATTEQNPDKQLDILKVNFDILNSGYIASHDPKIRQTAEKLKDFLKTNYPKQYKEELFTIQCLDTTCGNLVYPPEIQEVLKLIPKVKFKDPKTGESIIRQIEAANFMQNKIEQWSYYTGALGLSYSEYKYQKNNDPTLKQVIQNLANFLEINYPDNAKIIQTRFQI